MRRSVHPHERCDRKRGAGEDRPIAEEPAEAPEPAASRSAGTLYVVATPIGNLEDMTLRAIRILKEASLIAAEDTRRTRILLAKYGIPTPLTSLYDHNEAKKSGMLIARLLQGDSVAYVSDAGTPGISDPGYILVREAVSLGIRVVPVPGASALIAALSVSGLPMDSFLFLGFLPAKMARRRQMLASLREEKRTLIFYESPHRLLASMNDIAVLLGDREVVVSREMTKIYEEFLRGPAGDLLKRLEKGAIRGEVTLIVAGRPEEGPELSAADIARRCEELKRDGGEGLSRRDLAERIAGETGLPRRVVYQRLLFP